MQVWCSQGQGHGIQQRAQAETSGLAWPPRNTTASSQCRRHDGSPSVLLPRMPAGPLHCCKAPSWALGPTTGGLEETPTTSPTPSQYAQNLMHP